ncbi:MAG: hypothetical protein FWC40_01075 [Proteobacteria bacterium]|nr:hypothetical protein [Pseudomonadota bacterium]
MKQTIYGAILSLILGLVCANGAWAEHDDNILTANMLTAHGKLTTTRAIGLSNAMTASASGTSAVWHNPAAISSALMYALDAEYRYTHQDGGHAVIANLLDMKSNRRLGAQIGYLYEYSKPHDKPQHLNHLRLGLAMPLADNLISLGLTGTYSHIKYGGEKVLAQFSMDVGLVVRPTQWLSLAFAAQNLIVGDFADTMPRMISAGIALSKLDWGLNLMFEAAFNVSAKDIADTGSYGFGLEYVVMQAFPMRAGYRYDGPHGQHVLSGGLGYRDKQGIVGLDIAYQHHFAEQTQDILSVSLSLYF